MLRKMPVGDQIRRVTGTYEELFGFRQSWGMFAPNPSTASRGLELTVLREDGQWEPLWQPAVPPQPVLRWFYRRVGKVERNLIKDSSESRRALVARAVCVDATPAQPILGVRITRVELSTPPPGERPGDWQRLQLTEHWCRR